MKINTKLTLTPLVWARLVIITVTSFLLIGLLFFLYRDFYQTIIQAKAVIVLKQEVALENIDLKLYNSVSAIHAYKTALGIARPIADPFRTIPVPVAALEPEAAPDAEEAPQTP